MQKNPLRQPGIIDVKHTQSLFVDDLEMYKEGYKTLNNVYRSYRQVIIQVHGVAQCAKCLWSQAS